MEGNIKHIFRDATLQEQFDREGYVIVPMLTEADIRRLEELFRKFNPEVKDNQFVSLSFIDSDERKQEIRDALTPVYQPHLDRMFTDYAYFGSTFLYKSSGKNSDVSPHQDWTIVDEKKYVAVNIWTPLIDTNVQNGTLHVVPKSQYSISPALRAPTIPFYYNNYMQDVIKCCVPTNAPAGHAVILNQSLIHYSSPNRSDKIRIAITSGIKSGEAPMLFHFLNEDNRVERYTMPENFLQGFGNFHEDIYRRPRNGKLLEIIDDPTLRLSRSEFLEKFGSGKPSLWNKLKTAFG